jgi:hypothetical protein
MLRHSMRSAFGHVLDTSERGDVTRRDAYMEVSNALRKEADVEGRVNMNIYRRLGDLVGTNEARKLAEQLVAWHDAMVKHLRVLGSRRDARCEDDCPHEDAAFLWTAARGAFGSGARELEFLRSHGQSKRMGTLVERRDRAAEMRV